MKVDYPSKFINLSASVILLRPYQTTVNKLDYQILLLKRNSNLRSFANYFAFPGGMIEKQDYVHKWQANMPSYFSTMSSVPDFTKRMACIRELFEETNILLAT